MLIVTRTVSAIKRSAAVEDVAATLVLPVAGRVQTIEQCHQRRSTVDHRRVDNLSLAGTTCFQKCGKYAYGEVGTAAAEVGGQIQRNRWRTVLLANRADDAGERGVVAVMTDGIRQRSALSPAGHTAIDESLVPRHAGVRSQSESFHDAGPKSLEQGIRRFTEFEHEIDARFTLEIDADRRPTAVHQIESGGYADPEIRGRLAIDTNEPGTHIRQ